jgi:hypothetical protein
VPFAAISALSQILSLLVCDLESIHAVICITQPVKSGAPKNKKQRGEALPFTRRTTGSSGVG